MSTSKKANAAKAVQNAAKEALVGFNVNTVADAMRAMSEKRKVIDAATGEMADAACVLCNHAHEVATATREAGGTPSDSAWSKQVKAMLPMLAKEGSRFVKTRERDDGSTAYLLTGYGQNVNSIARGYVQYSDIDPADATDDDGNQTFGAMRTQVQERRKEDRSDDERALAESREAFAAAIKALRKAVGSNDRATLDAATLQVTELAKAFEAESADADAETEVQTETKAKGDEQQQAANA